MARLSRPAAVAGIVVTALLTVLPSVPWAAAATTTADPAKAAAGWLARQLVDGERFEAVFGTDTFADQGLTADAVLAFDAAGVAQAAAAKATSWLAKPEVLTPYAGDGTVESYAGSLAKLMLVAQAQGLDPTSFGGVNLVSRLQSRLAPSGRYSDLTPFPDFDDPTKFADFSNAIGQSLAVIALTRQGVGVPNSAVDFLAESQCADGGVPVFFGGSTCVSDTDATGFAVQAFLATARSTDANQALDFLVATQSPSGGFADDGTDNANSTSLALQAFQAADRPSDVDEVSRGRLFLRSLQVRCAGPEADRGAVAFTAAGLGSGDDNRATAQAVPALAAVSLLEISSVGAIAEAPVLECRLSSTATIAVTKVPTTAVPTTVAASAAAAAVTPTTTAPLVPVTIASALSVAAAVPTPTTVPVVTTLGSRPLARTGASTSVLLFTAFIAFAIGAAAVSAGGASPLRSRGFGRRVLSPRAPHSGALPHFVGPLPEGPPGAPPAGSAS